jgi:Flp pilus assembly protein TadG
MTRFLRRRVVERLRESRGVGLVEAALVTPLLILLTFSIVDFATLFYVYLALENGVSQASRFAVTGNAIDELSREDSIKTAMRNATPTLVIADDAFTFTHMPPGAIAWVAGTGGPGDIAKVRVDYSWRLFTPLVREFFDDGRINLTVESAMLNERRWQ